MRRIDELHLNWPFFGSRRLCALANANGFDAGRKHVATLMRKIDGRGAVAQARDKQPRGRDRHIGSSRSCSRGWRSNGRPRSGPPTSPASRWPKGSFAWWRSWTGQARKVLAWRFSNTLTTDFCLEALNEALARCATPGIFNTEQGAQFTDREFTRVLRAKGVRISMDGKGRGVDNVFVERLWRNPKYEEVYLNAYGAIAEAKARMGVRFDFHNRTRPHQEPENLPPHAAYLGALSVKQAA